MSKSILVSAVLFATALGWLQQRSRPVVPLERGTLYVESVVGGEAVIKLEAESEEPLERVEVKDPSGQCILQSDANGATRRGLSGLALELREASLAELIAHYSAGAYEFRAHTVGGRLAVGSAQLSFDLPAAPRVVYPQPGALVPSRDLTIVWVADRRVAGYHLQLEQDENDGLSVDLPPQKGSFRVPEDLLPRGQESRLELAALGADGNRTVVEIPFITQP